MLGDSVQAPELRLHELLAPDGVEPVAVEAQLLQERLVVVHVAAGLQQELPVRHGQAVFCGGSGERRGGEECCGAGDTRW